MRKKKQNHGGTRLGAGRRPAAKLRPSSWLWLPFIESVASQGKLPDLLNAITAYIQKFTSEKKETR